MSDKELLSVCFTGTCPNHTRAELVEMVAGKYEVKDSVTKGLDILVCADPNAGSSKLQKAEKNGVKIMSYDDFLGMLENVAGDKENAEPTEQDDKDDIRKQADNYLDKEDYQKALELYLKLADQNDTVVWRRIAYCYYQQEDYADAIRWWQKAAEQGDACAQYNLADCYENGEGVNEDMGKAVEWYSKAAEQGYADAQCELGYCYYCGNGVERDYKKAVEWYTKSAEQGSALAKNRLGVCYMKGNGVNQDPEKAVEWYTKAAEQGNMYAQGNLAGCYRDGVGVKKDYEKAIQWYRKAAEQGNDDAEEQITLLEELINFDNLVKLAEQGDDEAQEELVSVVDDYKENAQDGDTEYQIRLGKCYEKGHGVPQNYNKAFKLWNRAAKEEDSEALLLLGYCYENGQGTSKNPAKAIKCYKEAVDLGNNEAKERLAVCYEKGLGIRKKNTIKAVYWYKQAAKLGSKSAAEALKRIETMPESEQAEDAPKIDENRCLTICFLGASTCKFSREEIIKMTEGYYVIKDCVDDDIDILVCDDKETYEKELKIAGDNGAHIIEYYQYLSMLDNFEENSIYGYPDDLKEEDANDDDDDFEFDDDDDEEIEFGRGLWDDLNRLRDDLYTPNISVDMKFVRKVEKVYGIKAHGVLKQMLSQHSSISNAYQTCFFFLDDDAILHPKKKLGIDFKKMGLIPIADVMNSDYIIYDFNSDRWHWIQIEDEDDTIYGGYDDLTSVLHDIDMAKG